MSTKTIPCKFFKLGTCQKGTACPFSHVENKTICQCKKPILFLVYIQGKCKYGQNCSLSHSITSRAHTEPAPSLSRHSAPLTPQTKSDLNPKQEAVAYVAPQNKPSASKPKTIVGTPSKPLAQPKSLNEHANADQSMLMEAISRKLSTLDMQRDVSDDHERQSFMDDSDWVADLLSEEQEESRDKLAYSMVRRTLMVLDC